MKMNHLLMAGALLLSSGAMMNLSTVVHAEDKSVNTTGDVNFVEDDSVTPPVDPTDPTVPVDPVDPVTPTSGPLSIDYASSFHFDQQKISAKDETYYALTDKVDDGEGGTTSKPNWVQVTDKRGTNAGWKLQVQQVDQFKTTVDDGGGEEGGGEKAATEKELTGAEIKISNASIKTTPDNQAGKPTVTPEVTLVPGGAASELAVAAQDQGMGTWVDAFGNALNAGQSISMSVPGTTEKVKDATYSTELSWILSDTPA